MSMPTKALISPSKAAPQISTNTLDASFSSYLDGPEERFALKLGSKATPNDHVFLGKSKSDYKELDVFAAEKYFNETDSSPKPVVAKNLPSRHHSEKHELPLEILSIKPQPAKTTTPSIRSESSQNSRSTLLPTVPKNQQPNKRTNKKSFFARISCNCSCADKNSVDVDDVDDENKTDRLVTDSGSVKPNEPGHGKIKPGPQFTFPVFNPKPGDQAEKIKKSPQVFGGPENGKMSSGLEKKLAMMTWDATIPPISSEMGGGGESDASDASSDLFEIESLARGWAHTDPFRAAASDGCKSPTAAASTCYAPSEASVEWSVVTASAADFEDLVGSNSIRSPNPGPKKAGSLKEMPRLKAPGILSGCMSEKAISVGGGGDGFDGGRRNLGTESFRSATTRFRDEVKFDARNRQRS